MQDSRCSDFLISSLVVCLVALRLSRDSFVSQVSVARRIFRRLLTSTGETHLACSSWSVGCCWFSLVVVVGCCQLLVVVGVLFFVVCFWFLLAVVCCWVLMVGCCWLLLLELSKFLSSNRRPRDLSSNHHVGGSVMSCGFRAWESFVDRKIWSCLSLFTVVTLLLQEILKEKHRKLSKGMFVGTKTSWSTKLCRLQQTVGEHQQMECPATNIYHACCAWLAFDLFCLIVFAIHWLMFVCCETDSSDDVFSGCCTRENFRWMMSWFVELIHFPPCRYIRNVFRKFVETMPSSNALCLHFEPTYGSTSRFCLRWLFIFKPFLKAFRDYFQIFSRLLKQIQEHLIKYKITSSYIFHLLACLSFSHNHLLLGDHDSNQKTKEKKQKRYETVFFLGLQPKNDKTETERQKRSVFWAKEINGSSSVGWIRAAGACPDDLLSAPQLNWASLLLFRR